MVEQVDEVASELHCFRLGDVEVLHQCHVDIVFARTPYASDAARSPHSRWHADITSVEPHPAGDIRVRGHFVDDWDRAVAVRALAAGAGPEEVVVLERQRETLPQRNDGADGPIANDTANDWVEVLAVHFVLAD